MRAKGARLLAGLERLVDDGLAVEARGRGLMCAIDLPEPRAAEVTAAMLEAGYLINNTSAHDRCASCRRWSIDDEDLAGLVAALRSVLAA